MTAKKQSPAGRTYGGQSAAERLARQRRQFMDAGLELFGTVGYRATTVRMLCKRAGLIDRYFYKNFRDTEDLLAAVYTESLDRIEAEVVKAVGPLLASDDPARAVDAGLDAFFRSFESPHVARVCWLEVTGVSPRIDVLYTRRTAQFAELLVAFGRHIFQDWTLPDDEARITAIALVGAVSQSALFWLLSGYAAERNVLVSANARVLRGTVGALDALSKRGKRPRRTASRPKSA